jgi:hypothetical protein
MVRAGAFAAGGSLVALAACTAADEHSRLKGGVIPLALWFAGTVASLASAVRFGEPTRPRGLREHAARTAGALLVGVPLGVAAIALTVRIARPADVAMVVLTAAGTVLLAAATLSRWWVAQNGVMQQKLEKILLEGPSDDAALARIFEQAKVAAPSAAECERDAPAVELRALWGGDLLSVVHLDPPRTLWSDDPALGLAIPEESLGGARAPIVIASRGRIDAIAPPGSTGIVSTTTGRRTTVEGAADDGSGEPLAGSAATRIQLAKGTTVSVTFPSRGGASAYRAASGNGHAQGAAKLVFEIALVNAGRRARRAPALRSRGTFLVATGIASGVAALLLASGSSSSSSEDDEEAHRVYTLQLERMNIDERAIEQREALEHDFEELCNKPGADHPTLCASRASREGPFFDDAMLRRVCLTSEPWVPEELCASLPALEPDRHQEAETRKEYCRAHANDDGPLDLDPLACRFDDEDSPRGVAWHRGVIRWLDDPPNAPSRRGAPLWEGPDPALSIDSHALGLYGIGEGIGFPELQAHRPRWPWTVGSAQGFGGRTRRRVPGAAPSVKIGQISVSGALSSDDVRRVVRRSHGRFRVCYERGLIDNPNLQGRIAARFVVDVDGQAAHVGSGGSDFPDSRVISCVVRSFYGLSFPRPARGIATVSIFVLLNPSD